MFFVELAGGIEPPTFGLQNRCTAYCAKLAFGGNEGSRTPVYHILLYIFYIFSKVLILIEATLPATISFWVIDFGALLNSLEVLSAR